MYALFLVMVKHALFLGTQGNSSSEVGCSFEIKEIYSVFFLLLYSLRTFLLKDKHDVEERYLSGSSSSLAVVSISALMWEHYSISPEPFSFSPSS